MRYILSGFALILFLCGHLPAQPKPNIVLIMADDMGWGDPSYYSNTVTYADGSPHPDQGWIQTPVMDEMARKGLRFDRFYSASAVCSPTRASCLTGRNPFRVGVPWANTGRLGFDETPLSEVLAGVGYATGHFGKWHLGSMTTLRSDSNRGGKASVYSAPWHHEYDYTFATESKTPTYHPYRVARNGKPLPTSFNDSTFYGTYYWRNPDTFNRTRGEGRVVPVDEVNNPEDGDDSKLLVDEAIHFIRGAVKEERPFFAVIWFHTPHKPIVDPEGRSGVDSSDALRDSIEDLDAAIGDLRDELDRLGVRGNTMLWLTSDNGPERGVNSPNETNGTRSIRSGRLLERKRSLHEGGIRVPGILEWPDVISTTGRSTDVPAVTSDYYPTIIDYLDISVPDQKPLDGISLRRVIEGETTKRPSPIGFKIRNDRVWMGDRYKLIDDGSGWELYDPVDSEPGKEPESTPVATEDNIDNKPEEIQNVFRKMLSEFNAWNRSVSSDTPYIHASRPEVSLSPPSDTVNGDFTVTATFSEPVGHLHANEFVVTHGRAIDLTGSGKKWAVNVRPDHTGSSIEVSLPEGAVIDMDGNPNAASSLRVSYDGPVSPSVALDTRFDTVTGPFEVDVVFSDEVTGLTTDDFHVTNGVVRTLSGGGSAYSLKVVPEEEGDVTVTLPAGSATQTTRDLGNRASDPLTIAYTDSLLVINGDLNTRVNQFGNGSGAVAYSLDPSSGTVLVDGNPTEIRVNHWVWSTLSRGFSYDSSGGDAGEGGAFTTYRGPRKLNRKPRAVLQFVDNAGRTTGKRALGVDVYLDDNTQSGKLRLNVELLAWNQGTQGPALSLGGGTPNSLQYNVTNTGDARILLEKTVSSGEVRNASWQTVSLGTVDLDSGYDFYAWRIGIAGATDGDSFAFDNLSSRSVSADNRRSPGTDNTDK